MGKDEKIEIVIQGWTSDLMNYPAASNGVSTGIFVIAPRDGELNPCPPTD